MPAIPDERFVHDLHEDLHDDLHEDLHEDMHDTEVDDVPALSTPDGIFILLGSQSVFDMNLYWGIRKAMRFRIYRIDPSDCGEGFSIELEGSVPLDVLAGGGFGA